jgi:hypothetical protein
MYACERVYVCIYVQVVCMYVWKGRVHVSKVQQALHVCVCVFYVCIYIYYMNVCTGLVDVTQVQRALQGAAVLSHSQSDAAVREAVPGGGMTSVNFGAQRQV